jgi:hypothetical protein
MAIRSRLATSILGVAWKLADELWSRPMCKFIATWAPLVRDLADFLVAVFTIIKIIAEFLNKGANCNDRKLQMQI